MHDEELASRRIGDHGPCHGENASGMLQFVLVSVGAEFTGDLVSRAAHAGAFGIAALDHESGDDAMEDHAVIKLFVDQRDEVVDRIGSDFRIQFRLDDIAVLHLDGYDRIAHSY